MKKLLLTLSILAFTTLFSQNLELIGSISSNHFFDLEEKSAHFKSSYKTGQGYGFRLGIDGFKVDWLPLRFTLGYDKYEGKSKSKEWRARRE